MKKILSNIFSILFLLMISASSILANEKEDKLLVKSIDNSEEAVAHWAFAENSLEMVDSYSPFIFRTKKSQEMEEVKIQLEVDSMGRISGFDVLNSEDKGLINRLDYVIRKLPNCEPIPGMTQYGPQVFEMVIRK
ncbi:hypothetical protein [Algoriphagus sp. CAU 1675]|uniref:hypothetical protein n=1 Tax=Algoriphagus sp. CAU 1675 TaxID=3032597 RepID=UPI0023DC16B8|nr:hypothetical protein [Algoriphagus sp. CAU 1675]MDF2157011.1 hypothetical protein [Algoriphagus sp. CAU 1675]